MSSPITHAQSPTIHPLAHILGSCAFILVVAPFSQFNPPLSRCIRPQSTGGRSEGTQEPRKNGGVNLNHLHMQEGSTLVPISLASSCSLQRHHSVAKGHLHTFHPTEPWSTPHSPSAYFRRHYSSSQTALIRSLHVSKHFQFFNHSTCQLPSYSSSSTYLFIPNSIHS